MNYTVDVTVPEKRPKPPMRQAHFFVPEQLYLDFMIALKNKNAKMSPVFVDFMKKSVDKWRQDLYSQK